MSKCTRIPKSCVAEMLHENKIHSFKVGRVQNILDGDFENRLKFCRWYKRWNSTRNKVIWWSDECTFSLVPQINTQNRRYWSSEKLDIVECVRNSHVVVKMWVAISSEGNILYEFQEGIQTADSYLEVLKRQLPLMDLKTNFFQQDGASIHTANKEVKYLKSNYHHHWIGKKSGEKEWPPRSPDLSPLDFFFWSYVQSTLLNYNLKTKDDLVNALNGKFRKYYMR